MYIFCIINHIASNIRVSVNEFKRMWKEAVVAYFEVLSLYLYVWTKKTMKTQSTEPMDQEPNSGPLKYETALLTTMLTIYSHRVYFNVFLSYVIATKKRGGGDTSHTSNLETVRLVGIEVLTAVVMKSTIFWDITPCSLLKVNRRFGGTYRLHLQGRRTSRASNLPPAFTLVSCSVHSSTLKMEAICSSETSIDFQRTTWHCISEESTLR
jgi:hypothetical protein